MKMWELSKNLECAFTQKNILEMTSKVLWFARKKLTDLRENWKGKQPLIPGQDEAPQSREITCTRQGLCPAQEPSVPCSFLTFSHPQSQNSPIAPTSHSRQVSGRFCMAHITSISTFYLPSYFSKSILMCKKKNLISLFSHSADSKFNCFMYLIILKHHFFPISILVHTDKSKVTAKSNENNTRFTQTEIYRKPRTHIHIHL